MTVAGATGPAQIGGAGLPATLPVLSQLSQSELEFLAGRQQAERRSARLGSPAKADPEPMATAAMLGDTIPPLEGASTVAAPEPWKFMQRVVAWPGPDDPGYVNLHYFPPQKPGEKKPGMRGRAFRELNEFMGFANWCTTHPAIVAHTYFALATQAVCGKEIKGHKLAHRNAKTALKVKSIWLDIDAGPGKGYPDAGAAHEAVTKFVANAALPQPSALVSSGSGLHVYWISDRPLTVAEWRPYAEGLKAEAQRLGLKCDYGLTTDEARVLRVPGTTNGKTTPPQPVTLNHLGNDYDFATALARLAQIGGTTAGAAAAAPTSAQYDLSRFANGQARAFTEAGLVPGEQSLAAGIRDDRPLDPAVVFQKCQHFQDAALIHGASYPQGLWMLDMLACTFFEKGRRWAHYLSKGYAAYDHGETDAMWDRKLADKQRGVGWPSCQAFENEGCKSCATCPFKGKIRSPLNLAVRVGPTNDTKDRVHTKNEINSVADLMTLRDQGADLDRLLRAMNEIFAVVKYASKVMVASIIGKELDFMKVEDFHNLLANLVVRQDIDIADKHGKPQKASQTIVLSKCWFKWEHRRQYVGRGVVFEPGSLLEVPHDMINLWRGFGVEPKQGDWSLMRDHIRDVICSGNEDHFQYLIKLLAYGVQHPDRPVGVVVAIRGEEGAGKGFLWRNYGKLFGKHFKHIAQGEHLTGHFNAALADACFVFLDEALWAGDRKGEQILKALVTEDTFQLERKFCDPISVKNRLRIGIASNNDWIVPVGTRGRRNFVLHASDKYVDEHDPAHEAYWGPLHAQFGDHAPDDGRAAMLYDLLHMDLSQFNVRAVPNSAAKTEQKLLTQAGTEAWLFEILQDGAVTISTHGLRHTLSKWDGTGMKITRDDAYDAYREFSQARREYKPPTRGQWSRKLRQILNGCVSDERPRTDNPDRKRFLVFRPLVDCRKAYGEHVHAGDVAWDDPADEPEEAAGTIEPSTARRTDQAADNSPDGHGDAVGSDATLIRHAMAIGRADLDQQEKPAT